LRKQIRAFLRLEPEHGGEPAFGILDMRSPTVGRPIDSLNGKVFFDQKGPATEMGKESFLW
jgi:hypothetical protein